MLLAALWKHLKDFPEKGGRAQVKHTAGAALVEVLWHVCTREGSFMTSAWVTRLLFRASPPQLPPPC